MKKFNIFGALLSIGIALATGALSALFAGDIRAVYETLSLPPFSPPGAVFPIVWTILYIMMGIAAYLIYIKENGTQRTLSLWLYAIQLFLNFLWSIVFFRFRAFLFAYAIVSFLIIFVYLTAEKFGHLSKPAGFLMLPYLLWTVFAAYLNAGVAVLN